MKWFSIALTLVLISCVTVDAQDKKKQKSGSRQSKIKSEQTTPKSNAGSKLLDARANQPVPAQTKRQIMSFVNQNHPELVGLLKSLEKHRPNQFVKAFRSLAKDYDRLMAIKSKSPQRYEVALQQWNLKSRIQLKSAQLAIKDTPERRQELQELLAQQIDRRIQQLSSEQNKLESRLKRVNGQLEKVRQNRDDDVAKSLKVAIRNAERGRARIKPGNASKNKSANPRAGKARKPKSGDDGESRDKKQKSADRRAGKKGADKGADKRDNSDKDRVNNV